MAETVFSAIKRKFGGDLQSRLIEVKKKEIKLKALVYNLCILMMKKSYFLIIGFLQSLYFKRFLYSVCIYIMSCLYIYIQVHLHSSCSMV
ncbi:MAG: hypothetical protein QXT72_01970 [Candidatus Micrarchaeia archaeon]